MNDIEIINFATTPSIVSRYMRELRDVTIQGDPMRFRTNLVRIGEIMAYEISKRLNFTQEKVQTPLGYAMCHEISDKVGFDSAFYFSKVFKKLEGVSPREYMQRMKVSYVDAKDEATV